VASSEDPKRSWKGRNNNKISSNLVNNWITSGSFNSELSKTIIQVFLQYMFMAPETLSFHKTDSPKLFDFIQFKRLLFVGISMW